jgi:hypothetical protein
MQIPNALIATMPKSTADLVTNRMVVAGDDFRPTVANRPVVADRGVVGLGAGLRTADRRVADCGAVVLGAGFRLVRRA